MKPPVSLDTSTKLAANSDSPQEPSVPLFVPRTLGFLAALEQRRSVAVAVARGEIGDGLRDASSFLVAAAAAERLRRGIERRVPKRAANIVRRLPSSGSLPANSERASAGPTERLGLLAQPEPRVAADGAAGTLPLSGAATSRQSVVPPPLPPAPNDRGRAATQGFFRSLWSQNNEVEKPPRTTSLSARPVTAVDGQVSNPQPVARHSASDVGLDRERRIEHAKRVIETGGERVLPTSTRSLLTRVMEMPLRNVRVHTGAQADDLARHFQADAVAYQGHVAFRAGRYQPHEPAGVALLAHELTHAAWDERRSRGPSSAPAVAGEERAALAAESRALASLAPPSRAAAPRSLADGALRGSTKGVEVAGIRAAQVDRVLPTAVEVDRMEPTISEREMRRIKDEVYRDMVRRLRTEHERGA